MVKAATSTARFDLEAEFKQGSGFTVSRHAVDHGIDVHSCTDRGKDDNVS
jgi:hypothetical protein